ncbi:MAG: hypothetical protein ACK517_05035, partial [bacterium]
GLLFSCSMICSNSIIDLVLAVAFKPQHALDVGKPPRRAAGMMRVAQLRDIKAPLEYLMTQRLEDFDAGWLRLGLSHAEYSEYSVA